MCTEKGFKCQHQRIPNQTITIHINIKYVLEHKTDSTAMTPNDFGKHRHNIALTLGAVYCV